MLLDIRTDSSCMCFLWIFFFTSFPAVLRNIALKTQLLLLPSYPMIKGCILFQLWQDCEYRGSHLNPYNFGKAISM